MVGDGNAPTFVAAFEALEIIEFDAYSDLYRAAPRDLQAAQAIGVQQVGAATCLTSLGIDPATVFRRAVGLGVAAKTSELELDEVVLRAGFQEAYLQQSFLSPPV